MQVRQPTAKRNLCYKRAVGAGRESGGGGPPPPGVLEGATKHGGARALCPRAAEQPEAEGQRQYPWETAMLAEEGKRARMH